MENPYKIISSILSKDGFRVSDFYLKVEQETSIDLYKKEDCICIDFQENQPTVTIHKIIKIKLSVEGIELREDGGILKLDYFPNIPFKYEWLDNEE